MGEAKKNSKHSNLALRVMTGVPLALGAIALLWLGGVWFTLLVALAVWFAQSELGTFCRLRGIEPQWYVAALSALTLIGCAHFCSYAGVNIALLVTLIVVCVGEVVRFPKRRQPLQGAAATGWLIVYGGWFPAHAVLLRRLEAGDCPALPAFPWQDVGLVLMGLLLLCCIATDVGAYAWGKTLGKHRLCPAVSPGKTVEGAVGGVVTALLLAWGWSWLSGLPLEHALILAGVGSVIAQFGDLFESALKRDVGVKDASQLLPGHGGALDRLDSFLLLVPWFYIYAFVFLLTRA